MTTLRILRATDIYGSGNLNVTGNFNTNGDLTINNNISFGNTINATGYLYTQNNLNVTGICTINSNLNVNENILVNDTVNCTGSVSFGNDLTVLDNTQIDNDITVRGYNYFKNDLTIADNGIINNNLNVTGITYVKSDLTVHGASTINGGLLTKGNTVLNDTLTFNNTTLTILQDVNCTGNTTISGDLNCTGTTDINLGNVTSLGNTNITNSLIATSDGLTDTSDGGLVTAKNNVFTTNNHLVLGNITNTSNTIVNGNLIVNNKFTHDGTVNISENTLIENNLNITGSTTFSDSIEIKNSLDVNGEMSISGVATMNGNLNVSESVSATNSHIQIPDITTVNKNINVGGIVNLNSIGISGSTLFKKNLDIAENTNIGGIMSIAEDAIFNNNVSVNNNTDITNNLRVSGNITVDKNIEIKGTLTTTVNKDIIIKDSFPLLNANYTGSGKDGGFNCVHKIHAKGEIIDIIKTENFTKIKVTNHTFNDYLDTEYINYFVAINANNSLPNLVKSISTSGFNYIWDGDNETFNPTIELIRGYTYTININATNHPVKIITTANTDLYYNDGITHSDGSENIQNKTSGTWTFEVTSNTPNILYYQCAFHSSMLGTINIVDSPELTNSGIYLTTDDQYGTTFYQDPDGNCIIKIKNTIDDTSKGNFFLGGNNLETVNPSGTISLVTMSFIKFSDYGIIEKAISDNYDDLTFSALGGLSTQNTYIEYSAIDGSTLINYNQAADINSVVINVNNNSIGTIESGNSPTVKLKNTLISNDNTLLGETIKIINTTIDTILIGASFTSIPIYIDGEEAPFELDSMDHIILTRGQDKLVESVMTVNYYII